MMKQEIRIVIITGLSGAGKSQAVRCLEDLGYYCVDNLPPSLLPKFIELCLQSDGKIPRIALVIDIRGGRFFDSLFESLDSLNQQGIYYEILFLEAADEILVRRFKESRRRHPLSPLGRVLEGIAQERQRLEELRGRANKIIDTSNLSVHELKEQITELFGSRSVGSQITLSVTSFGYKYGILMDADLVMDVRFLPNPYYVEGLRELTGTDERVKKFVLGHEVTRSFITQFIQLLKFLIPHYIAEGKTHLGIAIGCTGGQHRSVVMAIEIGEALGEMGYPVLVKHRDRTRKVSVGV
ncbi:MAG: RNase adapter RapZ [Syntrophomonadaceae bacterium]|nr:RNase adapter RapZ [Syntrophomonadaceae bacterium]